MAKDLPYFKFYSSEWNDGDITLEDMRTQGVFINICSYYWSQECQVSLNKLQKRFKNYKKQIKNLIESKIICEDEESIKIKFLDIQYEEREVIKHKNKANGLKGGRPKITQPVNSGLAKNNPKLTNIEEKREEEKRKEENIKTRVLELPTMINPEECKTNSRDIMRYLETYQKIKSFNYSEDFSKVQGAYAEAVHHCEGGEAQVIQAAKDYLYFCQHMNESAKYRANHVSFLNKHQFKTDWLIQAENDFMAKNPKATGGTPMVPQFQERDKLEIELGIKFKWEVE